MSDAPPVVIPPRRRARWIVLGVIGLILLSAGGIFLETWISAGRVIEREREELNRRAEEIRSRRVPRINLFGPPEQGDAWECFLKALADADPIPSGNLEVFPSIAGDEVPKIDDAAIARMIEVLRPSIEGLKRALRRSEVDPGWSYDEKMLGPYPSIAGSIKFARILSDSASHYHRQGKDGIALEMLALAYGMGDLQAVDGTLVTELIRFVVNQIQRHAVKEILASHDCSASELESFAKFLERLEGVRPGLMEALLREDIVARRIYLMVARDGWKGIEESYRRERWYRRWLPLRMQAAQWLRWQDLVMKEHERVAGLDPWNHPAAIEAATRALEGGPIAPYGMSGHYFRAWGNWRLDRHSMALARLSVAVARFQSEKGSYPAALQDLAPQYLARLPVDPMNGKPFHYVNRGDSAIVYALGHDGDDDGGKPITDDDDDAEDGDIVWTVKRR